jgi:hypothetical protein
MVGQVGGAILTGGASLALPGGGMYGSNSFGSEIGAAAAGKPVSGGGGPQSVPNYGGSYGIPGGQTSQGAINDFWNTFG